MKKILALVLAMIMALSMGVAFADTTIGTPIDGSNIIVQPANAESKFYLNKKYVNSSASGEPNVYPEEVLEFEVTETTRSQGEDHPQIEVMDLQVSGYENKIEIKVPAYDEVGSYVYKVTEKSGNTAGVVYDTTTNVYVQVLITWNANHTAKNKQVVITAMSTNTEKVDTFTNKYELGDLSVKKVVDGNLSSQDAYFKMNVKFEAQMNDGKYEDVKSTILISASSSADETKKNTVSVTPDDWENGVANATIWVKHNETIHISNIPVGVTYTVTEDEQHLLSTGESVDPNGAIDEDYTVTYDGKRGKKIEANDDVTTVVTNKKETGVTTGMFLDNAPYMIIMALVLVGAAMMLKRRAYND